MMYSTLVQETSKDDLVPLLVLSDSEGEEVEVRVEERNFKEQEPNDGLSIEWRKILLEEGQTESIVTLANNKLNNEGKDYQKKISLKVQQILYFISLIQISQNKLN